MAMTRLRGMDAWSVPSASRPGRRHLVRCDEGGYSCTCEAGSFRRLCRHVREVDLLPQGPDEWGDVRPCPECGAGRMAFELGLPLRCLACERAAERPAGWMWRAA